MTKKILMVLGNIRRAEKEIKIKELLSEAFRDAEFAHEDEKGGLELREAMRLHGCEEIVFCDEEVVKNHAYVLDLLLHMGIKPIIPVVRKAEDGQKADFVTGVNTPIGYGSEIKRFVIDGFRRVMAIKVELEDLETNKTP